MSLAYGINPQSLDESGWGVLFAPDTSADVRAALEPLIELRRAQAGPRFADLSGEQSPKTGESKQAFLARHKVGPGPVDPNRLPYYLLIIGGPDRIPFAFQQHLGTQFAVGRLHFDSVPEYRAYAESVVRAESATPEDSRRAVLFAPSHSDDRITRAAVEGLVEPLTRQLRVSVGKWEVETKFGPEATKESLRLLLGGSATPALLLTATHGLAFPVGSPRHPAHQGALVCQDWPGPKQWPSSLPGSFYLAADDVEDDAIPFGLVALHLATFSAGTPEEDEFTRLVPGQGTRAPFVARLPRRLLAHPNGGALAVLGLAGRVWGHPFAEDGTLRLVRKYHAALHKLCNGWRVGHMLEDEFGSGWAIWSSQLASELEEIQLGKPLNPLRVTAIWSEAADLRNWICLGDPAVRLLGTETTSRLASF